MANANVSTPSPRMAALMAKRELVNDLMGGTFTMRSKAQRWLPKHPAESDGVYKTRLDKTFLDNFLSLTIDKAAGKIFKKEIKRDEVNAQIAPLLDNIDLQGSGFDPFAQAVGKRSLGAGITYVMVDVPPSGGAKTQAEERAAGIRPYCVHIDPDQVIEILSEMTGGKETLRRIRIKETVTEREGDWGFVEVEQIRVLEMRSGVMCYDVYREQEVSGRGKVWMIQEEMSGVTTFPEIFLTPFYSNRVAYMEGVPGFQNIAESTLEHWQIKSEYTYSLSMQCFGMLTVTGIDPEEAKLVEVGPAKLLCASGEQARFTYTEPTGKGVELAEKALSAIESRIETAGVNLRVENAGKVTATAASLDSEETNAGLMAVANSWSDSWAQVLYHMALVMKQQDGGTVEIQTNFGGAKGTPQGLASLDKARALGDISRDHYLDALIWRAELPETFDKVKNAAAIEAEGPPLGAMGGTGADGGGE